MQLDDSLFRRLVDGIADYAIIWLEPDGRVAVWNAGATRTAGYDAADAVGMPFASLFDDADRAQGLPAALLDAAMHEGRAESDGWRVAQDGRRFWASTVVDAIHDGARLAGFGVVMRDRTERRRVDEELRRSQEQFRVLVQGVADYAIYMLDPDGYVTSWNSGAERIKGYLPAEIIGEHYSRFYAAEDVNRREPWTNLEAAAREGRAETEGWRLRKDGTRFWAHVVIDRITDETGKILGFAKVTRDVTDRRATERELAQAREALFQSQKLEAIGQLTGGVAHDFNNLLMAIRSNLELLDEQTDPAARSRTLVANALAGVQRGVSLTQRMLAFARRQELHLEPVDLAGMLNGMAHLLHTSLGSAIQLDMRLPDGLPAVQADTNQLELCVLNLCVNGRDAMPDGGRVTIVVEPAGDAEQRAAGLAAGRYVKLSVKDTGEGMDPETLARATEPFFTTKGVGKGTGLGLSMVHGIAQQLGGTLVLDSRRPGGTTVTLFLPVCGEACLEAADSTDGGGDNSSAGAPATAAVAGKASPTGPKILVVDDDPLVLSTTVELLDYDGYDVAGVVSAREALLRLEAASDITILVTDHAMPGMTGTQLAAIVAERWPSIRIILATGYAEMPHDHAIRAGRLNKPFGRVELIGAIEAAHRA